jgi:hypothetical protein
MKDGIPMKMNKLYEIHFSPTGGTERVSKIFTKELADRLAVEAETVDLIQLIRDGGHLPEFTKEDICVISVPSFAGLVPLPAVKSLAEIKGNGARAILNVVFGNRAIDDTLLELRDILEAAGFVCAAAMETVAEHSIFRQFGAARPDAEDEAELKDFAAKAAELEAAGGEVPSDTSEPAEIEEPADTDAGSEEDFDLQPVGVEVGEKFETDAEGKIILTEDQELDLLDQSEFLTEDDSLPTPDELDEKIDFSENI